MAALVKHLEPSRVFSQAEEVCRSTILGRLTGISSRAISADSTYPTYPAARYIQP